VQVPVADAFNIKLNGQLIVPEVDEKIKGD
jgi:hypothetical protein